MHGWHDTQYSMDIAPFKLNYPRGRFSESPVHGRNWISWRVQIVAPIPNKSEKEEEKKKIPHTGDTNSLDRDG